MSGSTAFASADAASGRTLVVGVSWIGDTIMSWPAIQAWRAAHPSRFLAVLAKPAPAELWRMHAAPHEVWTLERGAGGVRRAVRAIRHAGVQEAWIFPHSLRSALIPWLAGVPVRIGMPGHAPRDLLLTRVAPVSRAPGREHQQFEYLDLMGCAEASPGRPELVLPAEARARAAEWTSAAAGRPCVAMMPGAARGPSKCWPVDRFEEVARRLARETDAFVVVCGGAAERDDCRRVAAAAGERGISLAGWMTIAEWAATLAACRCAVANDSGGMHLAAAVGTPVVAIFGRTDPAITGPLGAGHAVLQAPGIKGRDVPRRDEEARRRLEAIRADEVWSACRARL
ncbi:MAG: lipopolysaccharide heptosyltransferase II [Kiritimatiellae bacterium]|nr:lipopolysaccharide heptosyltransferase II [Kiritimatiellia bacterium]